jgi:ribosomal protein L7Ae-like RNA K-turn-binding protein
MRSVDKTVPLKGEANMSKPFYVKYEIPYVFVPNTDKLGNAVGIDVPCAAACIIKEGEATGLIKEIITRIEQVKRGAQ